jgi:hypothetical protein
MTQSISCAARRAAASRPRNIREPAKGNSRCSLSRRHMIARSAADASARVIGQWLSERLGQQFVVETRAFPD